MGKDASAGIEYTLLLLNSRSPAFERRQYSSTFSVPTRLCSINCRRLVLPSTPASTLGLAAASITQSAGGSRSRSLDMRTSP